MTKPDLTNPDRLPFGELDRETQEAMVIAVILDERPLEVYSKRADLWLTLKAESPRWGKSVAYRIPPLTPPSINWDHVSERYNVLTVCKDGEGRLRGHTPIRSKNWWRMGGCSAPADSHQSFDPGTETDWTKRIAYRPGYKEQNNA